MWPTRVVKFVSDGVTEICFSYCIDLNIVLHVHPEMHDALFLSTQLQQYKRQFHSHLHPFAAILLSICNALFYKQKKSKFTARSCNLRFMVAHDVLKVLILHRHLVYTYFEWKPPCSFGQYPYCYSPHMCNSHGPLGTVCSL